MKRILTFLAGLGLTTSLFANTSFILNESKNSFTGKDNDTIYVLYPNYNGIPKEVALKILTEKICQDRKLKTYINNGMKVIYFYLDPKEKNIKGFKIDSCE